MNRRYHILTITLVMLLSLFAGNSSQAQENSLYRRSWKSVATSMPREWYYTPQADSVAGNILLYQRKSGGWPKNIEMHRYLSAQEKVWLASDTCSLEATIDNDATITEMRFLAKMYSATKKAVYRRSFERGLDYVLSAQYPNGGWPQFYPVKRGYYTHITYNDNAMINVMELLQSIFNREDDYKFTATRSVVRKAREGFDKGVECILKTQIIVGGKPTVWCAQHDETTLLPAKARSYELPSFSGSESAGVTALLMSIPDPSPEIIAAVDGAVEWFESHKITGIKVVSSTDVAGVWDRRVVTDEAAPAIWARFYDLDTGLPYFCDRDGIKKATLAEIGYERRNGYSWYGYWPQRIIDQYPVWKKNIKSKEL